MLIKNECNFSVEDFKVVEVVKMDGFFGMGKSSFFLLEVKGYIVYFFLRK